MTANQKKKKPQQAGEIKKTGVNKGMSRGVTPQQFDEKVFCNKCHKEVEVKLGSELFLKCPRCNDKLERNLQQEQKQIKKIIHLDILRRSKRAQLITGWFLLTLALVYNIVGFLVGWFNTHWWLGFASIPFVILAFFMFRVARKKSASKVHKAFAWFATIDVIVVLAVIMFTTIPYLQDLTNQFLDWLLQR